jgi:transcription antitermination factor NusA-like protein
LKVPICSFDAKTGVLCSKCEAKLQSGSITQDDVDASIKLSKVAGKSQEADKFTLVKGARVDDDFVLVLRGSDIMSIRSNPNLSERISKEFGQKVWFVESESSERQFLESLFHPFKIINVNQFWLPDGKVTKVIAAGRQDPRINVEKFKKIAKAVRNIELLVEFEIK